MQSLTFEINSSLFISGPLVSPARTTLFVVVKVSQATLACGSIPKYVSTTMSDILSQTLSGCPSDTDLIQGDGADTLLGSHNTYPYMDKDRVADLYQIDKMEAKTRCKQRYYMNATNPNKDFEKGSGHLFEMVAKDLG